jgi:hypothetical protein
MGWLMAYENYTIKTQEALQDASSIALKNDCPEIGVAHVLMALLQQQDGIVPPLVERIGVSCSELRCAPFIGVSFFLRRFPILPRLTFPSERFLTFTL